MNKKINSSIVSMIVIATLVIAYTLLIFHSKDMLNNDIDSSGRVAAGNVVVVNPSDNVQSIINSNPSGTTYIFSPGIYRQITVQPKDNDTLIGEYGAILNGAKLLDPSTVKVENGTGKNGINLYYFENQTQQTDPKPSATAEGTSGTGFACASGYMRCVYNEDLYVDDNFLRHAESKGEVDTNMWFFDYNNDRIYMADNPNGKKIETSVTQHAVNNWGEDNITFKNFIVEKYATAAQRHAIELMGKNNTVAYNEVRLNHGGGIKTGDNSLVSHNYVHHNGQIGFGGRSDNAVFEYNEVAYNNQLGFEMTWEAGGSKWSRSTNLTVKNNYSHNNGGPGFWTDIDNVGVSYDGNIVVDNEKHGIQHEISFDGTIKNNFVAYNGGISYEGKQIYVQISQNVDVYNNIVVTNESNIDGIIIQNYPRGNSSLTGEPRIAKNNNVYKNDLYHGVSTKQIIGLEASDSVGEIFSFNSSKQTNLFYENSYCVNDLNGYYWNYGPYGQANKQYSYFQSQGQDVGSPITTNCTIPVMPAWNVVTGQVQDINNPSPNPSPNPNPIEEPQENVEVGNGVDGGNGGGSTGLITCGSLDSDSNGKIDYVDLKRLESIYKQSCNDSYENYSCGHVDSNRDGIIDIIDFVNFATKINKEC